jgi:hypothetical protein
MLVPDATDSPAKLSGWAHPTGRWPKRVALVSLGVTHQDYVGEWLNHDPADTVYDRDETWTLNRGALVFRHDLAFIMDYLDGERRKWPRYGAMLARHDKPIITSQADGWPDHVHLYPQDLVRRHFGAANDYYHNSVPWILAYAVWIGVREITLWGCDYTHERSTGREDDRANAEYWVALARAHGVAVAIPETSTLCNASRGPHWYGYRDPPGRL